MYHIPAVLLVDAFPLTSELLKQFSLPTRRLLCTPRIHDNAAYDRVVGHLETLPSHTRLYEEKRPQRRPQRSQTSLPEAQAAARRPRLVVTMGFTVDVEAYLGHQWQRGPRGEQQRGELKPHIQWSSSSYASKEFTAATSLTESLRRGSSCVLCTIQRAVAVTRTTSRWSI